MLPLIRCLVMIYWIAAAAVCVLLLWIYFKFFKIPKVKNLMFVDGGLGTGKSTYSVYLAVRLFKRSKRHYKIAKFIFAPFTVFRKSKVRFLYNLGNKYDSLEEPLLYSNIPLRNIVHTPLTLDLIYRMKRFPYKSVVLIDDISLMADQMMFKNLEVNKRLSVFFKFFRHMTRGGYLIANSSSTSDLHHAFKYCLSDYLYIHSRFDIPFFSVLRMQEMHYSADKDGSPIVTAATSDIEDTLKRVLVRKKYRKYYDTYCYSVFTDNLQIFRKDTLLKFFDSAKCVDILTLDDRSKDILLGGMIKDEQTVSS